MDTISTSKIANWFILRMFEFWCEAGEIRASSTCCCCSPVINVMAGEARHRQPRSLITNIMLH